jgi:hypothetical protein
MPDSHVVDGHPRLLQSDDNRMAELGGAMIVTQIVLVVAAIDMVMN